MPRSTVIANDLEYQFSADENVRGPLATWAIVSARALDEITGRPPDSLVWLTVREPGLRPRVGPDGLIGLVVQPLPRFPRAFAPGFSVHVTLGADRYLPRTLQVPIARSLTVAAIAGATTVTLDARLGMLPEQRWVIGDPAGTHETVEIASVGPGPSQLTLVAPLVSAYAATAPLLPDALTPIALGDIALHRMPVTVRGRVMVWVPLANAFQAAAAATVDVPWTWRRQADVTNDTAKEATRLVSLAPGLYRDRVATSDTLQPVTEAAISTDDKGLLADVLPGDSAVRASNATGVAAGTLLRFDREHPDVRETIPVASVVLSGGTTEPVLAELVQPLRSGHRHGTTIEHVTATNVFTGKPLQTDGLTGDPVVFLSDVTFGGTPSVARLAGGVDDEYQRVNVLTTTTDADGYFALPPLSRVAKVRIAVTPAAHPTQNIDLEPDYSTPEQWLDVHFS